MKAELTREELERRLDEARKELDALRDELDLLQDDVDDAEDAVRRLEDELEYESKVVAPMPAMKEWAEKHGLKVVDP